MSAKDPRIKPFDGLTRYLVRSDVNPQNEYLVDLDAYWGIGKCSCAHHTYRMAPELERPGMKSKALKIPDQFRCKHITLCRQLLGNELVNTLTRTNNETTKALKNQSTKALKYR